MDKKLKTPTAKNGNGTQYRTARGISRRSGNGNGNSNGNGNGHAVPAPEITPTPAAAAPPRFDTGLRYGTPGLRYFVADQEPTPSAPVSKVKMDLRGRTNASLIAFVRNHITMMTGNTGFATPQPAAAAVLTALTTFEVKMAAAIEARNAAKVATTLQDMARTELEDLMVARGAYVQTTSSGNAALIESTGLEVSNPPTPTGPLPPPGNLRITLGEVPGMAAAKWEPVPGARGYVLEYSLDVTPRQFTNTRTSTKAGITLENMEVGKTYVFHVSAVGGSTGQSPWSLEVTRGVA